MKNTEALQKVQEDELHRRVFERMAEDFVQRYAPDGRHQTAQFTAQFYGILRQLAIDVQGPTIRQLVDVMSKSPWPQFLPSQPENPNSQPKEPTK